MKRFKLTTWTKSIESFDTEDEAREYLAAHIEQLRESCEDYLFVDYEDTMSDVMVLCVNVSNAETGAHVLTWALIDRQAQVEECLEAIYSDRNKDAGKALRSIVEGDEVISGLPPGWEVRPVNSGWKIFRHGETRTIDSWNEHGFKIMNQFMGLLPKEKP